MTADWHIVCDLATRFHVETWGKELWLVKHDTKLVAGYCNAWDRLICLPFRPQVLCAKAEAKQPDLVEKFTAAVKRWT